MIFFIYLMACNTNYPLAPWDDPEFATNSQLQFDHASLDAHYFQVAETQPECSLLFHLETDRPQSVQIAIEQLRRQNTERCQYATLYMLGMICKRLRYPNRSTFGDPRTDAEILAALPMGCQWIGYRTGTTVPHFLDQPIPWLLGENPHDEDIHTHFVPKAEFYSILIEYERKHPQNRW